MEDNCLKNGAIKSGFLYKNGCMLWLFQFCDKKGKPVLTLDCPFDAKLLPRDELALHSIENEQQRLAIEIHVVDEHRIVRALRLVTLSNKMTLSFLSSVQDQLTTIADQSIMERWMDYPPFELIKDCDSEILGEK